MNFSAQTIFFTRRPNGLKIDVSWSTVNSLLSPPGGLLISNALEGGLIGEERGRLIREEG